MTKRSAKRKAIPKRRRVKVGTYGSRLFFSVIADRVAALRNAARPVQILLRI
jgi:hypothetical protein